MNQELKKLPPSTDEYWTLADVEIHQPKPVKPCPHEFIHRTALEVVCKHCMIGYYLDVGHSIKNGHIYQGEKLVI